MKQVSAMLSLALCLIVSAASGQSAAQRVGTTLDDWHHAAAIADEARYFEYFAPNGVFMGTDPMERWTASAFHAWAKPYFDKKKAWTFKTRARHIDFSADGKTGWFDELLDTQNLGLCRGSGVLVLLNGQWKIAQYNLSIPIPNALVDGIVKQIGKK